MRHHKFLFIAASAAALTVSQSAMAAGFAVSAQSAFGMGNAYAGNAALGTDASTALTNPAGMFELEKPVFAVSAALTATVSEFTDQGSLINPLFGAEPVATDPGDGPNEASHGNSPSPGIYYARPLNNKWAVGFAFHVPFATASEYDDNWVGRYHAVETSVRAFDFNPSVAYKVNEKFSIGGGISVQYATALLTSKLDSGATCLGIASRSQGQIPVTSCTDIGLIYNQPALDSDVELEGTGTQVTFNLGAMFKPREGTKIGLTYRHGANHELEGDATFDNNQILDAFLNAIPEQQRALQSTGNTISADLPAIIDLSVSQKASEKLELLGTIKWTQWSSFDTLTSSFDNPAQPDSGIDFQWEDSVMASAGLNYTLSNKLTLRAGFAFDQTPIPNPTARSPRGPTNNRYWYSVGGTYKFSSRLTAHLGMTHIQIDESAIDNPGSAGNPTLRGSYEFDANLLAFQLNWNFI